MSGEARLLERVVNVSTQELCAVDCQLVEGCGIPHGSGANRHSAISLVHRTDIISTLMIGILQYAGTGQDPINSLSKT